MNTQKLYQDDQDAEAQARASAQEAATQLRAIAQIAEGDLDPTGIVSCSKAAAKLAAIGRVWCASQARLEKSRSAFIASGFKS